MRVCMVVPYDLAEEGGVKRHAMQLAATLRRLGDEVDVIGPCTDDRVLGEHIYGFSGVVNIPANGSDNRLGIFANPFKVWRLFHRRRYDVVHVHEPLQPSLNYYAIWSAGSAARVGTFHSCMDNESPRMMRARKFWGKIAFPWYDRGIAVSPAAAQTARVSFDKPLAIIPNGIRTEIYTNTAGAADARTRDPGAPLKILFVGHWRDPRKGLPFLLEACGKLAAMGVAWTLDVVGDGGAVARSDLAGVTYHGAIRSEDKLAALYAGTDVFVSPAVGGESFGIVLLEAMAASRAIVCSDLEGYRYAVGSGPESGAVLVPPGSADGLAAALAALAADPARCAELGARNRERVRLFEWDRLVAQVRDEYTIALAARAQRRAATARSAVARLFTWLALRHPVLVVALGIAITIAGVALASRLTLQTDLAELLPPRAPSVVSLHELSKRVGGTGGVAIAVESLDGTPAPLRAYIPRLALALRAGLGKDLLSIRYSRKDVSDYYARFAAYYVPLDELDRWSRQLSVALAKQNPAYVELDDQARDPLRALADDVRTTKAKLGPKNAADPDTGLLMAEGGRLGVVFVRPASSSLNLGGSAGMMGRIEAIAAATDPAAAGVKIAGYTGSIPVALGEVSAIKNDIVSTAILVILGVGAVVTLFFRGIRELVLMSGAVIVGAAVALGFAELWIGHVNAQTAFLGAIIVGTGINYGIIFLDRYRQARAAAPSLPVALETACDQTLRATGIAAAATAISFGVLAAGEIESFHQFGWIGGIGILACWIATFTVVPACIVLADHGHPARPSYRPISRGFRWLGRCCEAAPRRIVAVAIAIVAASVGLTIAARHDVVETDLRKLGTRSTAINGIEALDARLRTMDDRSSTPAVIATGSRAETRPVCDVLNARARGDLKGILRRCYSLDDLFPQDLARRAPLIDKLRHDVDLIDDTDLAPEDRKDFADLRRALAEPPPAIADLPPTLSEFFVERDGSIGKLAYVEPFNEHIEKNLYLFTDAIRSIPLPSGKVIESSGELVVFADVLRAMRRDATKLTLAAALLVLLVLAIVTRRAGAFVRVGGALIAGVAVMFGIAVLSGQKLNFFNFVALPTTFGIGIDYAINIEERIRQAGRAALPAALAAAGPAVVLASLTSIIGYASLLVADSQALASFGALAMIGELACVVVALVLVPALWALRGSSGHRLRPALAQDRSEPVGDHAEREPREDVDHPVVA